MAPTLKPSLEERVTILETDKKVTTGQFRTIVAMGTVFWGIASAAVYDKLDAMENALSRIPVLEQHVNLLQYQQKQQDVLNNSVVAAQERMRSDIDARYSRLTDRLNTLQRGN